MHAGTKFETETVIQNVTVPPGATDGIRIRIPGNGHESLAHKRGDILVVIRHKPHQRFQSEGSDFVYNATISLPEALLGFSKHIHFVNGSWLPIERNDVTFSGYRQRIPGWGLPKVDVRLFR